MTEEKTTEYIIDSDTLGAMGDYFLAAIRGEENKTRLLELWKTNLSVATSSPYDIDAIKAAEKARMQPIIDAVKEFINRCENGEIRSKYTYNKFKGLLKTLSCDSQDGVIHNKISNILSETMTLYEKEEYKKAYEDLRDCAYAHIKKEIK